MNEKVKAVNDSSLSTGSNQKPVLVDFWAVVCALPDAGTHGCGDRRRIFGDRGSSKVEC
jgi:hypothetical protein